MFLFDDVRPDGFRVAFDGFGGDFQAGQQLQLCVALVEADLAAHHAIMRRTPGEYSVPTTSNSRSRELCL